MKKDCFYFFFFSMVIMLEALAGFSQCGLFLSFYTCDLLISHEGQESIMERMFGGWKISKSADHIQGRIAKDWEKESKRYLGLAKINSPCLCKDILKAVYMLSKDNHLHTHS